MRIVICKIFIGHVFNADNGATKRIAIRKKRISASFQMSQVCIVRWTWVIGVYDIRSRVVQEGHARPWTIFHEVIHVLQYVLKILIIRLEQGIQIEMLYFKVVTVSNSCGGSQNMTHASNNRRSQ